MWNDRKLFTSVFLVHVLLVPALIPLTLFFWPMGDHVAWEHLNTWTPIIGAQSVLLSLFLGLGTGPFWSRFAFCLFTSLYVTCTVVWAYSRLCPFPEPQYLTYLGQFQLWSIVAVLPVLGIGAALLPARLFVGQIGRSTSSTSPQSFRIVDLLAVTAVVAVAAAWIRLYRATTDLPPGTDFTNVIKGSLTRIPEVFAAGVVCFGRRHRLICLIALIATITASEAYFGFFSLRNIWLDAYQWSVVFITLAIFRASGFRLSGTSCDLFAHRQFGTVIET